MSYLARQVDERDLSGVGAVIDLGGRDINGSPRRLFGTSDYTVIDLHEGPGVDVIADARDWAPEEKVDVVVCAEVLEHAADPAAVLDAAKGWLKQGGVLLVTAAGPGREPHSGLDGGPVRSGEHYANIDPDDLREALTAGWYSADVEHDPQHGDVYAVAVRR